MYESTEIFEEWNGEVHDELMVMKKPLPPEVLPEPRNKDCLDANVILCHYNPLLQQWGWTGVELQTRKVITDLISVTPSMKDDVWYVIKGLR